MNIPLGREARIWRGGVAGLILLAWAALSLFSLPSFGEPFCPLRRWLGLPCLLCGGSRAAQAILQADWEYAWHLNPFAVLLVLGGSIWAGIILLEAGSGRRILPRVRWTGRRLAGLVLILLAAWTLQIWSAVTTPRPELLHKDAVAPAVLDWFARD